MEPRLSNSNFYHRSQLKNLGLTLWELLLVIIVLLVLATLAIPTDKSSESYKIDLAASQLAKAFEYARELAIRTTSYHGVDINYSTEAIQVFQYGSQLPPLSADIILEPLSKNAYSYQINTDTFSLGVVISNTSHPFQFKGLPSNQSSILFNDKGEPFYLSGSTIYSLTQGVTRLTYGVFSRLVIINPISGLVTIQ